MSLSAHPPSRRLLVAGSVQRIIGGFDLREPLHADGMDLRDPVFERNPLDVFFDLAILELAFEGDELTLLESAGELREMAPGIDAMPFGTVLVVAPVVLPALLGGQAEGDVLFAVLSGFGFCVLSEAADEDDFVEHGVWLRFLSGLCRCLRYMLAQRVCRRDPLPRRLDGICGRGPKLALGQESTPRRGAQAGFGKESVRPKGVGVLSAAR